MSDKKKYHFNKFSSHFFSDQRKALELLRKLSRKGKPVKKMDDRKALLRTIRENPQDPTPRAVFADWLEERGLHHDDNTLYALRQSKHPVVIQSNDETGDTRAMIGIKPEDMSKETKEIASLLGIHTGGFDRRNLESTKTLSNIYSSLYHVQKDWEDFLKNLPEEKKSVIEDPYHFYSAFMKNYGNKGQGPIFTRNYSDFLDLGKHIKPAKIFKAGDNGRDPAFGGFDYIGYKSSNPELADAVHIDELPKQEPEKFSRKGKAVKKARTPFDEATDFGEFGRGSGKLIDQPYFNQDHRINWDDEKYLKTFEFPGGTYLSIIPTQTGLYGLEKGYGKGKNRKIFSLKNPLTKEQLVKFLEDHKGRFDEDTAHDIDSYVANGLQKLSKDELFEKIKSDPSNPINRSHKVAIEKILEKEKRDSLPAEKEDWGDPGKNDMQKAMNSAKKADSYKFSPNQEDMEVLSYADLLRQISDGKNTSVPENVVEHFANKNSPFENIIRGHNEAIENGLIYHPEPDPISLRLSNGGSISQAKYIDHPEHGLGGATMLNLKLPHNNGFINFHSYHSPEEAQEILNHMMDHGLIVRDKDVNSPNKLYDFGFKEEKKPSVLVPSESKLPDVSKGKGSSQDRFSRSGKPVKKNRPAHDLPAFLEKIFQDHENGQEPFYHPLADYLEETGHPLQHILKKVIAAQSNPEELGHLGFAHPRQRYETGDPRYDARGLPMLPKPNYNSRNMFSDAHYDFYRKFLDNEGLRSDLDIDHRLAKFIRFNGKGTYEDGIEHQIFVNPLKNGRYYVDWQMEPIVDNKKGNSFTAKAVLNQDEYNDLARNAIAYDEKDQEGIDPRYSWSQFVKEEQPKESGHPFLKDPEQKPEQMARKQSPQKMDRAKAPAGGWYEQTPFGMAIPIAGGRFMPKESVPPEAVPVKKERTVDFTDCIMAPVDHSAEMAVKSIRDQLPEDWIEKLVSPHITIFYGFNSDGKVKQKLKEAMQEFPAEATAQIKGLAIFDSNALVALVDCPLLQQVNEKLISSFENKQIYPFYKPHITICYLKPDVGRDVLTIAKKPRIGAFEVDLNNLILSRNKDKKFLVRLEK